MLIQIVLHTPLWVWAILLALLWLGLSQTVSRQVGLRRIILLPLAMTAMSLHGTFTSFGATHWSWVLWTGAALATVAWFASSRAPAGVAYQRATRVFNLPGSWVPLCLMMAIFAIRYVVGVVLALHPELTRDLAVAAMVASLYGALSGVFIGRMLMLLGLARTGEPAPAAPPAVAWG